jgi:hypothetical protein
MWNIGASSNVYADVLALCKSRDAGEWLGIYAASVGLHGKEAEIVKARSTTARRTDGNIRARGRTKRRMNLRALVWITLVGCASTRSDAVSVPLPPAPSTRATVEQPPANAARAETSGNGAWARSLPHEKEFAEYDVLAKSMVLVAWNVGRYLQLSRRNIPDDDFAVNFGSTVDLAIDRVTISFGAISGKIVAPELAYCARLGWHKPDGPVAFKPEVVSTLLLDIPQSLDDFMVVRDGATLHVLHRHADDDFSTPPWSLRANVRLAGTPIIYERVEQANAPVDCGAPLGEGTRLLPPG